MFPVRLIGRGSLTPLAWRVALDRRVLVAVALGTLASIVSIWVLLSTTDAADVRELLSGGNWALVGLAVASLAVSMLVRTARWQVILPVKASRKAPPVRRVLPVVLVGYAINVAVPLRLGDLFRGLAASRRFQIGKPEALGSVGLERVVDAAALAAVAALASAGSLAPTWLTSGGLIVGIAAGGVLVAVYLMGVVRRGGPAATDQPQSIIWRAWAGFRAHPRALATAWLLSALAWAIDGVTVSIVARSLSLHIGWETCMLIATGAALAAIVPSAPASIGTFHLAGTAVGVAMGMNAAAALAVVVLWHAITVVPLVVAGLVAAAIVGLPLRAARETAIAGGRAPGTPLQEMQP